jgi:hypothetical protein
MQFSANRLLFRSRHERSGSRRAWLRLCVLGCLSLAVPRSVRADAGCTRPQVHWRTDLPVHWQRALLAACDELAVDHGLDPSVEVRATQHARDVQLDVSAGDGRTATRTLHNTDDLLMTMQALLLLPPSQRPRPEPEHRAAPSPSSSIPAQTPRSPLPPSAAPAKRYDELHQAMQAEIGALVMGRLAFLPDYISPALCILLGLHLDRITLGIDVRWNPFQTLLVRPHPVGLEIESLGAGFFAMHRVLDADWLGLDLGLQAFLSADTQAWEVDETATENTEVDGRVGVLARWGIGSRSARWTIVLDAELSPARLRTQREFPAFSVGLGGGGVWEVK